METELRLAIAKIPNEQEEEIRALMEGYEKEFERWRFQLLTGFSLLFYGLGSKQKLLEAFAKTFISVTGGKCVEVLGYLPHINLKEVFHLIAHTVWQQNRSRVRKESKQCKEPAANGSVEAFLNFLANLPQDSIPVTVVVHSLDGSELREGETQKRMARLASCSCVHLVASVDHMNAPLMWDRQVAFKECAWWWHHTPTFHHYGVEGEFQTTLLLSSQGADSNVRGAGVVLSSLTPNARSCFALLAASQIQNKEEAGIPFHRWFFLCREKFLVTNELTLRAHQTEFRDHQLLKSRRATDGQDCLYIPLQEEDIEKLLEDIQG